MTTDPPRPGLMARLKLTEPVRLYLHSVGLVLVAGLVLMGYLTDEWSAYLTGALAVVLGVGGGGEMARSSVFSPYTHYQAAFQVARARGIVGDRAA